VPLISYIFLLIAVAFGTVSNTFTKNADGFTKLIPSTLSIITIILCMFFLSKVMKTLPIGITYASFAGLCIIATVVVGTIKFNQVPDTFTLIGLGLIISGVFVVNVLGKT